MQRIVESPFAFLFPSKLQPAEIARKLEQAIAGDGTSTEAGPMPTQALSAEQLALLRSQLSPGQQLPGLPDTPIQPGTSPNNSSASSILPGGYSEGVPIPPLPQAWFTIR